MLYHRFTAGDIPRKGSAHLGRDGQWIRARRSSSSEDASLHRCGGGGRAGGLGRRKIRSAGLSWGESASTFRLDQFVKGVLMVDSLFPTLGRIAQVEKAGGMQPGGAAGGLRISGCARGGDAEWSRITMAQSRIPRPECSREDIAHVVAEVTAMAGLSKVQSQSDPAGVGKPTDADPGTSGHGQDSDCMQLYLGGGQAPKEQARRAT